MKYKNIIWLIVFIILSVSAVAAENKDIGQGEYGKTFMFIAVILIAAKLSSLVEKWGQPAVLGELLIGIVIGSLGLFGIHFFEPIKHDPIIGFLAELGIVILLFQIGLESHIDEMKKVGFRAGLVAILGVIVPFILGTFVLGPWLLPGNSLNTYLFLGAALTATSVGITARVFKDLGKLQIKESKIVLGAAVIDDVLGLVILAVVSAIVTSGSFSLGTMMIILLKSLLFLVSTIIIGQMIAPYLGAVFSRIHTGIGMKFTLAICLGLLFAYFAELIGLAGIVGAFAAGLILDPVHFRFFKDPSIVREIKDKFNGESKEVKEKLSIVIQKHSDKHIRDIIEPIGHFVVPIFFVVAGMAVNIETLFNGPIILVSIGITIIAILSKLVAGLAAGKCNKWIVGWGMVPRGEVGLIFATVGMGLGVISESVFSVIVIMVILTTLLPPPILGWLLKKQNTKETV